MILTCLNPNCKEQFLRIHSRQKTCSPSCSKWLKNDIKRRWLKTPKGKAYSRNKRKRHKTKASARNVPSLTSF